MGKNVSFSYGKGRANPSAMIMWIPWASLISLFHHICYLFHHVCCCCHSPPHLLGRYVKTVKHLIMCHFHHVGAHPWLTSTYFFSIPILLWLMNQGEANSNIVDWVHCMAITLWDSHCYHLSSTFCWCHSAYVRDPLQSPPPFSFSVSLPLCLPFNGWNCLWL